MIYINRFLDKIKVIELNNTQKIVMTISEARNLHTDITKLLLAINEYRTKITKEEDHVVEIKNTDW